jgi:hypothetical protein
MADKGVFWAGGFDPAAGRIYRENFAQSGAPTAGQTVGLCLDRAPGPDLGPNVVTNGTFDTDLSGWTATGNTGWSDGAALVPGTAASGLSQACLTSGHRYVVQFVKGLTTSMRLIGFEGTAFDFSPSGTYFRVLAATSATLQFTTFLSGGWGGTVDNLVVRRAFGNAGLQATATSRPTLRQTSGLWHLENDGGDSLNVTTGGTTTLVAVDTAGTVTTTTGLSAGATNVHPTTITNLFDCCLIDEATATTADVELSQAYMGSLI